MINHDFLIQNRGKNYGNNYIQNIKKNNNFLNVLYLEKIIILKTSCIY